MQPLLLRTKEPNPFCSSAGDGATLGMQSGNLILPGQAWRKILTVQSAQSGLTMVGTGWRGSPKTPWKAFLPNPSSTRAGSQDQRALSHSNFAFSPP